MSSFVRSRPVTRRSVSAGAVWAVPVIAVAASAPAMAASQCVVTTNFDGLTPGTTPTTLTFLPSTVTATLGFTSSGLGGDNTPGDTGEVAATSTSPSWNYIEVEMLAPIDQGDSIQVTISLTEAVENLTFKIHDIDGLSGQWQDTVRVDTAGFTFVPGANIIGDGSNGTRFRNATPGDDPIDSGVADVTLSWVGPVQTVSFSYIAGRDRDTNNQHIGLGDISFTDCVFGSSTSRQGQDRQPATATPLAGNVAQRSTPSAESADTVDR